MSTQNFQSHLNLYAKKLHKQAADVEKIFAETSRGATLRAIEAASEKTPPVDDLSGTNTRSGHMKEHWAADSISEPAKNGGEYATELKNNAQYASYVDQGHRMDKHFVPGLMLNPLTEKLEQVDRNAGGIMVGVKTKYVPGVHAAQAGHDAFEIASLTELRKISKKVQNG